MNRINLHHILQEEDFGEEGDLADQEEEEDPVDREEEGALVD